MHHFKKVLAGLIFLVFLAPILAGCGNTGGAKGKAQELVIGYVGFGENGDLNVIDEKYPDLLIRRTVQEPLLYLRNGKLAPALAESWEVANGGKDITFHLKKGVTFHDGAPFNADAVKFTLDRIKFQKGTHPLSLDEKATIEIKDPYTVVFHMSRPSYETLIGLAEYHLDIIPPTSVEPAGDPAGKMKQCIGTGPWKVKEYKKGEYVELVPYEKYRGEKPKLSKLVIKPVPDPNTRVMALKSGELGMILDNIHGGIGYIPRSLLNQLEESGYGIAGVGIPCTRAFVFNYQKEPFNNPEVRKALAYAVDKEALAKAVMGKWVDPALNGVLSPVLPFTKPQNTKWYPYDPERAKTILAHQGWKPGPDGILEKGGKKLSAEIIVSAKELDDKQVVEIVQSQFKKAGVQVNIKALESSAFSGARKKGEFDLAYFYAGGPECRIFMRYGWQFCSKGSATAPPIYTDTQLDSIVEKALTTFDDREREDAFTRLGNYVNENAAVIPVLYDKVFAVTGKNVQGFKFNGSDPDFSGVTVGTKG